MARFPSTMGDVEEASKCFALARYCASVFHSLKVLEIGVIELGRVVGVTDHKTGWDATTNRLNKVLTQKHP